MTTPELPPEMAAAAREFNVNEAADAKKLEAKAAAVEGAPAAADVDAGTAPKSEQEAKQAAAVEAMLANAGMMVWHVADALVVKFAGAEFKLTPEEKGQLAAATGPVIDKYAPDWLQKLLGTPEGQLALVAAGIYGPKAYAALNAPATPPSSPPAEAPKPPEAKP